MNNAIFTPELCYMEIHVVKPVDGSLSVLPPPLSSPFSGSSGKKVVGSGSSVLLPV